MTWTDGIGWAACALTALVVVTARVRPVRRTPPPMRSAFRIAFLLAVALTAALSTVVISHAPDVLRAPVAAVTVLLAPGYAVVVPRGLDNVLDELALALAVGFALLVLVGTAMATAGNWQPYGVVAASTLVSAPVLARHAAHLFLLPAAATRTTTARD